MVVFLKDIFVQWELREINDRWLSLLNTPYWFQALALIIFVLGDVSVMIWLIRPKHMLLLHGQYIYNV